MYLIKKYKHGVALLLALLSLNQPVNSQESRSWPWLYEPTRVLELHLEIAPADWDVIRLDQTNSIKVPARLSVTNDEAIPPVEVEVRRKSSRALPDEIDPRKIGMKVDIKSGLWLGVKKLSLENGSDASPLKEGLAWLLHEIASPQGYHAALAAWVTVSVNGELLGAYVNAEQRDKQFLRNRELYDAQTTWMYKQDDIGLMERDVAPTEELSDLRYNSPAFTELCQSPFQPAPSGGGGKGGRKGASTASTCPSLSDSQLLDQLDRLIDMSAMLRQGAVDAFTDNGDALFTQGKNFFVVDFSASRNLKRLYYPWDLDGVFRSTTSGIYGIVGKRGSVTQTPYQSIILNHAIYRSQFNVQLSSLIADDGPFGESNLEGLLDRLAPSVLPALESDPYQSADINDFIAMKNWFAARRKSIASQIIKDGPPSPRP